MKPSRRNFLTTFVLGLISLPILKGIFGHSVTLGEAPKMVSETDPVANAIGYKADVKNIDYKKYPKRKEKANQNQFCENCALYTAVDSKTGKCQMLTSGLVTAKGWCGSYSKKA